MLYLFAEASQTECPNNILSREVFEKVKKGKK